MRAKAIIRGGRLPEAQREGVRLYQKLLGPLLVAVGIFYLAFHAVSGERGIYALLREQRRLDILNSELMVVEKKSRDLDRHVRRISAGSLDRDLLDEQARSFLGLAAPDELLILLPAKSAPAVLPAGE